MKYLLPTLLAIGGITLMTSGCGESTLDYRNTELANGKIYSAQDNSPYTGLVTNLPNRNMKPDDELAGILELIKITVAHYKTEEAFYYADLICNSEVEDGFYSGLTTCLMPKSSTKRYTVEYSGGYPDGEFKVFAKDGSTVLAEGQFKNGKTEGELSIYGPNNGRLIRRINTENGLLHGFQEQMDESTGTRLTRVKAINGKFEGPYETWNADGAKTGVIEFENGLRNGTARVWDPETGTLILENTFVDNAMHGPSKKWSTDGKLIESGTYKRNAYYPDPTPALATPETGQIAIEAPAECIDLWIGAHRAEKGEDAWVSSEQLDEWSNWCDEGKRP